MQKNFTLKRAETRLFLTNPIADCTMQPKQETLQMIMMFAAAYRPEEITEGHFSDICLN